MIVVLAAAITSAQLSLIIYLVNRVSKKGCLDLGNDHDLCNLTKLSSGH